MSKCRPERGGGGYNCISTRSYHLLKDTTSDLNVFNEYIESVFIEIDKSKSNVEKNVVIGVIYRPPNTDIDIFNEYLGNILDKVGHEKILSYTMGDYDIDLLNYDSHTKTALFLDTLYSKSSIPLFNRPTQSVEKRHTIIDNTITNDDAELQCSMQGVLLTDISDHYPIFSINLCIEDKCVNTISWRRNLSEKRINRFKQLIAEYEWHDI